MTRRELLAGSASLLAASALTSAHAAEQADFSSKTVLMLAYPGFTALDLVGPQTVFASLPGFQTHLVWKEKEEVVSDTGLTFVPSRAFRECKGQPTILFVPGGTDGTVAMMKDTETLDFLREQGQRAEYVTSVCTGSLLLGCAGLLQGYQATSHWLTRDLLGRLGAKPVAQRVVLDRNRVTGAGVTAGLDFALTLAAKLTSPTLAQSLQLAFEYDPRPPFKGGTPETADPAAVAFIRAHSADFLKAVDAALPSRLDKNQEK